MRLATPPRRKMPLSLTPLIDVVFLLLIFFMLASTFLKFSAMPIAGATGGGGAPALAKIALIQIADAGRITVNGRPSDHTGLKAHLDDLLAKGVRRAVIKAAAGSTVQDLVRVLEITRSTTLENVVVVK